MIEVLVKIFIYATFELVFMSKKLIDRGFKNRNYYQKSYFHYSCFGQILLTGSKNFLKDSVKHFLQIRSYLQNYFSTQLQIFEAYS